MFNNREIATAIWLTLFAIWILTKSNVRASIAGVFRAFLNWKILTCVAVMILYTAGMVAVLYAIGFWQLPLIKDTVLWFCFTAFVMVMRFSTSRDNDNIMRTVFADNLKMIIFLEFLVGTYVMSLPAELVFVPFVTSIALWLLLPTNPSSSGWPSAATKLQMSSDMPNVAFSYIVACRYVGSANLQNVRHLK